MFRDKTDFHAVLLSGEAFADIRKITRLLTGIEFERDREAENKSANGLTVHYGYVYSATPYVRNLEKRDAIAVKRGSRDAFRFDTYIITYNGVALVAFPFLGLLKEVLGYLGDTVRGDVPYQGVKLDELIAAVLKGDHMGGKLRLRALDFDVRGDSEVSRLMFRGENTLYSRTYSRLIPALKEIKLAPRACAMTYDDHAGNKVSLEADRFGNFGFRVATDAANLPRLRFLLSYMIDGHFLATTHVQPTRRLEEDE